MKPQYTTQAPNNITEVHVTLLRSLVSLLKRK